MISDGLAIPVKRWTPLSVDWAGKADECKPWAYRLSVAFGLALRKFERAKK